MTRRLNEEELQKRRQSILRHDALEDRWIDAILAEIQRRGLTRQQLARETGLSASTVARFVAHRGCFSQTLLVLLEFLGMLRTPKGEKRCHDESG